MATKKTKTPDEVSKTLTEVEDDVLQPITTLPGIGDVRAKRLWIWTRICYVWLRFCNLFLVLPVPMLKSGSVPCPEVL